MDSTLNCSKCGGAMEEGFVMDIGHSSVTQSTWVEGKPERSLWTGLLIKEGLLIKDRQKLSVTTFRCETCGFLESYAKGETPA